MKKILLKTGVTLIELIVTTILVAIVVLGILSINGVLKSNHQDYGQRYLVTSETQTTLNTILNSASSAIGSGGNVVDNGTLVPDLAVLTPANTTYAPTALPANTFCIHQNPTNSTTGDIWTCYTLDLTSTDAAYQQILSCQMAYNLADPNLLRGAAACPNTSRFVGTANSIGTPIFTDTGTQVTFTITIQNCLNNSASSCNGNGGNPGSTPGVSSDPADNPEVQLTGSAFPTQANSS